MKYLVTGGAGFIGSNLVERLVRDGHDVTVVDNLHSGSEDNLASVRERVRFVQCQSGDTARFDGPFDGIFHQGVYSSTPMYKEDPRRVGQAISDFIALLELSRRRGIPMVWASTSSLYNGQQPPHREDMPVLVTDFYTEARVAMERVAQVYHQLYGTDTTGLRYFSVYGPHEKAKGPFANLVTQFLWDFQAGRRPKVFGDGSQSRDFTYVDDVVRANLLAMQKTGGCRVYNIGTGTETTLNQMIAAWQEKLKTAIQPEYVKNTISNYVSRTQADTAKAEKELGFKAQIGLAQGMDRLIQAYPAAAVAASGPAKNPSA